MQKQSIGYESQPVERKRYSDSQLNGDFLSGELREGMRPAAALRAAQIKMWKSKQWSSPYYWAAFQIQGEWR